MKSHYNWFLISFMDWLIQKGLNLGSSPPNHAKTSLKILSTPISVITYLYYDDKIICDSEYIKKFTLPNMLMLIMISQLSKLTHFMPLISFDTL